MNRIIYVALAVFTTSLFVIIYVTQGSEVKQGASSTELSLEAKPLAPQDILATLDIVSKQKQLGNGGDVSVVEGRITVGRPIVYRQVLKAPQKAKLVNPNGERFYLVKFPFTLHPLPERQCTKLKFSVTATTPSSFAHKLIPDQVLTVEEGKRTDEIGFSISIPRIGADGSAKTTNVVRYVRLTPVIKSYGLRQPDFYWVFEGFKGAPVEDGSKVVAAVMTAPRGVKSLHVTLGWQIDWRRRMFDVFSDVPVTVEKKTIDIDLQ